MYSSDFKIPFSRPDVPQALREAGYTPLLAALLGLRGITRPEDAERFLRGGTELLRDPLEMLDMDKAAGRLRRAVEGRERVAVYGDYDVDGITATCLVTDWLRARGLDVTPYIPDRIEEGYGLNTAAIDTLKQQGVSLIVTVDCGITAVAEARRAAELGLDMIITDHHECRNQALPRACAVVDPKREDCPYPNKELAGVGVALKLVCAAGGDTIGAVDRYADLVAIGTVADVMPLTGENRYLVRRGLDKIATAPSVGVAALLSECGMGEKKLTATSIGFTLAPRLNAAGRLGKAATAAKLLMASDEGEAAALAAELCELNHRRQSIEMDIWKKASVMLGDTPPAAPIVLASDNWHQGVIGIAASRLAEQYSLPAVMICLDGDKGKGSCRSYGGFNLFEALSACADYLEGFGGHALAAGLTIRRDRLDDFRAALAAYYQNNIPAESGAQECQALITDPTYLDMAGVEALAAMEPYGNGNPKPVLCFADARVESLTAIGGGKHVRMLVSLRDADFECICFSCERESLDLNVGDGVDLAFTPQINDFRGRRSVQLVVCGIRRHDPAALCALLCENGDLPACAARYCPQRADFVRVWRSLKAGGSGEDQPSDLLSLCPEGMEPERFCLCLRIWCELGLLTPGPDGGLRGARINAGSAKVDLDDSLLLQKLRKGN